jgi:hypothetical protein
MAGNLRGEQQPAALRLPPRKRREPPGMHR